LLNEGWSGVIWVDDRIVSSYESELVVHDPDAQNSTKLQSNSKTWTSPGRCGKDQVVFVAYDEKHHFHVARTDVTTGSTTALTDGPMDHQPTCTPDGDTLVYGRGDPGNRYFLIRKSLNSGQSDVLHEFDNSYVSVDSPLSISPDGKSVLFRISCSWGEFEEAQDAGCRG
jgi:Tol biopolymer transport system component